MDDDKRKASARVMEDFMQHYRWVRPFFKTTAQSVMRDCQRALKANPQVRANFSNRVKKTTSLRQKLRKLQDDKNHRPWSNTREIWDEVFDIAGIRIVLYLPSQSLLVEDILNKMIDEDKRLTLHRKIDDLKDGKQIKQTVHEREAGGASETYQRRFLGYLAKHYQLQVATASIDGDSDSSDSSGDNGEGKPRKVGAEIQVVSAPTHIWAEIEHDIEYKKNGTPSLQELRLLDGYQGIVSGIEIFLEQLESTWSDRIAEPKKKFADVADLMSFLKSRMPMIFGSAGNEWSL